MNVPLIKKFEYGYRAGVLTTNPRAKVLVGYTGNWTMYPKGASWHSPSSIKARTLSTTQQDDAASA
jgi:basic membrane lipoprotein Med (substrate-binding protein (PBP1-ABC) superfamily)